MKKQQQVIHKYSFALKARPKPIQLTAKSASDAAKKLYKRANVGTKYSGFGEFINSVESCVKVTSSAKATKQQIINDTKATLYNKYKDLF